MTEKHYGVKLLTSTFFGLRCRQEVGHLFANSSKVFVQDLLKSQVGIVQSSLLGAIFDFVCLP